MSARFVLVGIVLGGSAYVWRQWIGRWRRREPLFPMNDQPRAGWNSAPELSVVYVALLWMVWHLLVHFLPAQQPAAESSSPDVGSLATAAALNIGLALILPLAVVSNKRPPLRFGLMASNLCDQLSTGVQGFFGAAIPMAVSMFVTAWFRGPETQNSLLKLLADSPDWTTLFLIIVLAAISAPLLEEMLFRVILQGWLTTLFPPSIAITVVAVLFSFVHGWRDGIALLPLSLILGYVFYRRHSYLSVVVIHALFNGTIVLIATAESRTQ